MNEQDLLEESLRYIFTGQGMSDSEAELKIAEFRARFKTTPPKELSEEEYATRLAQLKEQAPAFLHYLMTNKFPNLPDDFFQRS